MDYMIALHVFNKNYRPLGKDGKPVLFKSLEAAVACIADNNVPIMENTVILRLYGDFIADEYNANQIREMIANRAAQAAIEEAAI